VVTVVTTAATGLAAGGAFTIIGVTPTGFNGNFSTTSVTPPDTFTYQDLLGTVAGSGGDVQLNNVWYYTAKKRSSDIFLLGPFSGDTADNRLNANVDGFQIVAVVVLTNSGGIIQSSGGGGSPISGSPAAGAFF
jgi:hypothetical protein